MIYPNTYVHVCMYMYISNWPLGKSDFGYLYLFAYERCHMVVYYVSEYVWRSCLQVFVCDRLHFLSQLIELKLRFVCLPFVHLKVNKLSVMPILVEIFLSYIYVHIYTRIHLNVIKAGRRHIIKIYHTRISYVFKVPGRSKFLDNEDLFYLIYPLFKYIYIHILYILDQV